MESVWAEIDQQAIALNVKALKALLEEGCELMAVVKANGYGHGICPVSRIALENGASSLGVARVEEALALREGGIAAPVLLLGRTSAEYFQALMAYDICQTVWSYEDARELSDAAAAAGKQIRVHIKLDSGMGRLGMPLAAEESLPEALTEITAIAGLPGILLEGVYTHFSSADEPDKTYTKLQLRRFLDLLDRLERTGIRPSLRHAANSAAMIDCPDSHLDMVRPGIAIYGLYPSRHTDRRRIALCPAMCLKTRIVQLKEVPADFPVSYGGTYRTLRPTTLAVVPVGYADGLNRLLSSRGHMLVRGKKAPIVGRVCMDLTVLDVGGIENVQVEDEVVVFGRQGEVAIEVDEIAGEIGTINYEVVSTITDRVPRVYV